MSEQTPRALLDAALHLPRQVLPIYEFAERTNPYAIVVCDLDARPIGVALEAIRDHKQGLLSVEDRLFYRRVSKRVPAAELVEHLRDPLELLRDAGDAARVMVVDDYVSKSAGTYHAFREACRKLGMTLPIDWVTLAGKGTAFNAVPYLSPATAAPWRDRPDVIGISYEGTRLIETPTPLSVMFYDAVHQGVRNLFEDMPT